MLVKGRHVKGDGKKLKEDTRCCSGGSFNFGFFAGCCCVLPGSPLSFYIQRAQPASSCSRQTRRRGETDADFRRSRELVRLCDEYLAPRLCRFRRQSKNSVMRFLDCAPVICPKFSCYMTLTRQLLYKYSPTETSPMSKEHLFLYTCALTSF